MFDCLFSMIVCVIREEHIGKKVEQTIAEAKEKLAKGDKKGAFTVGLLC